MIDAFAERRLLRDARGGDREAFARLTEPHLPGLRARCRRMLGSVEDGDDALQDALLRAWRGLPGFQGRSSFKGWLFTIANHAALKALEGRGRRVEHFELTEPEGLPEAAEADPAVGYERRERLELAFLAAVHCLPPRQRAVVILHEGLGWNAREVADALGTSPASVNSALQRARDALSRRADGALDAGPEIGDLEQALLCGYIRAWTETDVERVAALARRDDARTTLMRELNPRGGGWVLIPDDPGGDWLPIRSMFAAHPARQPWQ